MALPRSTPLARPLSAALLAAAALAFGGCNSLLDNRSADIGEELFETVPADGGKASREATRDGGASAPSPDAGAEAGAAVAPLPPQCLVGTKPCGELCVSTGDPYFGCGGPTCERCAPAHATAACAGEACAIGACAAGWADCNGLVADGCETDLAAPASCGACGVTCGPAGPNAESSCVAGACVTQCAAGFGDCNADPADGCEADLMNDGKSCGQCGKRCIIGSCQAGDCFFKL